MQEIVKNTIEKIENDYKINGLYKLERNKNIFCIHVNSIINIGLLELDYASMAINNINKIASSPLYSEKDELFYKEANDKNKIVDYNFNACKNAIAALSLVANNKKLLAEKIINSLYKSPLFNKKAGLFYREFNLNDKTINHSIITQTNLWMAITLIKLQRNNEARKIIRALEKLCLDQKNKLFLSQDCNLKITRNDYDSLPMQYENIDYFSDDQALAIIAYKLLGENDNAKNLLSQIINSVLFDSKTSLYNRNFNSKNINKTKTSYKNALMGIALGMMGRDDELNKLNNSMLELLYDKKESLFNSSDSDITKIPDNSMLALLAINFNCLKHTIF